MPRWVQPPDDGAAVLRVSAGLSESLDRIERETLPFIASGGGEIQFVFGPYGRGKTHFLKALAQWASERGCVTAYVDCQSPFESLVETYRAIAARMTPPGTHKFFAATGITRTIEARFTGLGARRAAGRHRTIESRPGVVAGLSKPGRRLLHGGSDRGGRRGSGGPAGSAPGEHVDISGHAGRTAPEISTTAPTAREARQAQCGSLAALGAVAPAGAGLQRE